MEPLTLKEFLDSFKEKEKKEVQVVFEACRLDIASGQAYQYLYRTSIVQAMRMLDVFENQVVMPWENWGQVYQHLDETSTIQAMKTFVESENQVMMPWENWDSTSKVVKVGDYTILENWAPILYALLTNNFKFSVDKSRLSRMAVMLNMMIVCIAIHNMCSTKVKDLTANLLWTWFHSFMFGQYAGFELNFAFVHLVRLVHAYFGLHANFLHDPNLSQINEEVDKLQKKLDEMLALREFRKTCLSDAQQLKGHTAAMGLL
ncbi:hypothetical protein LOK49_LG05G00051 [Camellia lanceoleosa]|uniref:Uncharacterized protein n=1 Tax=Camellia lanceoleosa TaxID=1840588 RepID=A0ACC0HJW3_9ERIC|nr:hypothetical protein LOK49_LG05G00051 [Camellia lanceoleosa]